MSTGEVEGVQYYVTWVGFLELWDRVEEMAAVVAERSKLMNLKLALAGVQLVSLDKRRVLQASRGLRSKLECLAYRMRRWRIVGMTEYLEALVLRAVAAQN